MSEKSLFSAPPETHTFNGLLFDMDGTIIDSTVALNRHWRHIASRLGIDPTVLLATSHGRRSIDTLAQIDPAKANWDYVREIEALIPQRFGADAKEIPGARQLLDDLTAAGAPWAVVTSGTRPLVNGWLDVLGLPPPAHLVTAEDVECGKPDPACYVLGRDGLGLRKDAAVLVLEDSPAGVRAGKDAGFRVVGLATSHSVEQLREAAADWIVRDMRSIVFKGWAQELGAVTVEISDALES